MCVCVRGLSVYVCLYVCMCERVVCMCERVVCMCACVRGLFVCVHV